MTDPTDPKNHRENTANTDMKRKVEQKALDAMTDHILPIVEQASTVGLHLEIRASLGPDGKAKAYVNTSSR